MASVEAPQRFIGPNRDIPLPRPVELPPRLEREMPFQVAVLAEGAITPLGTTAEETWKNYRDGINSGIIKQLYSPYTELTLDADGKVLRPAQIRATTAARVKNFDPMERLFKTGIVPFGEAKRKLDPYAQYPLAATFEALFKLQTARGERFLIPRVNQEGYNKGRMWIWNDDILPAAYAAVMIGSGFGGGDVSIEVMDRLRNQQLASLDHMLRSLLDRPATVISQATGMGGGVEGDVGACASSGKAIHNLIRRMMTGEIEFGIAGGTEASLGTPITAAEFDSAGALDQEPDPDRASRPLHKDRGGFVPSEGAVVFAISTMGFARKHGMKVLYTIDGFASTSGAGDNTAPEGVGQEQAMRLALRRAEYFGAFDRGKILNFGHYTATPTGDVGELMRTQNVLYEHRKQSRIVAMKSYLGHMLGAAGAGTGFVAGKAIQEGVTPGTKQRGEMVDELDGWECPPETVHESDIETALCSEFGFGDQNEVRVLRRA